MFSKLDNDIHFMEIIKLHPVQIRTALEQQVRNDAVTSCWIYFSLILIYWISMKWIKEISITKGVRACMCMRAWRMRIPLTMKIEYKPFHEWKFRRHTNAVLATWRYTTYMTYNVCTIQLYVCVLYRFPFGFLSQCWWLDIYAFPYFFPYINVPKAFLPGYCVLVSFWKSKLLGRHQPESR